MFPSQINQDDIHNQNLSLLCRVCGDVKFSHPSPSVKVDKIVLSKYIKKLYNVDVASEDSCIYPAEVCQSCERKLKRFYLIVSKRKKCSFSKDSLASYTAHSDRLCLVCSSVENQRILEENLCSETLDPVLSTVGEDGHHEENVVSESYSETPRRNPPRKPLLSVSKPSSLVSSQTQTENIFIDEVDGLSCKWFNKVKVPSKYTSKYSNKQNSKVNVSYFRKLRFKPLCLLVDKFCHSQKLNKIEALFFLLTGALQDSGDKRREVLVRDVWSKRNDVQGLSLEQCLAMRVLLKLTKETYKRQYTYYKEKLNKSVLKSPCQVDKHEKCFLPRSVDYHVTDASEAVVRQHTTSCSVGLLCKPHLPDVVHSRWLYSDVIAKTLQELIHLFKKDLSPASNQLFKVTIKEHFEDKSPQCDGYEVPACTEGRGATTPHLAAGLRARLLTGYCTFVALQAMDDSSSVNKLDESITENCRPFFRALYTSESRVTASGTQHDRQCAEHKYSSLAKAEQISNAPKHPYPSSDAAAAYKTCTNEPTSVVMLHKNERGSSVSTSPSCSVPPEQHTRKPCAPSMPTSPLASQGHESWLCLPAGAPQSLSVLLDVLQQERQELLANLLHVVCPNSNTTYRFVVSFEDPQPEILKGYRNTRGLVRLHPCDEKSWLPRALGALSRATGPLDSRTCAREQGSRPAPTCPEDSDAAPSRGRTSSSGSQPPLLDMVRLYLVSSPRLRAAGSVRTRGQRNTYSAGGAGLLTAKPGSRRTVQRSAPRPQEEAPLQGTEGVRTGEELADNSEDRGSVAANPNDVSCNTVFSQSATEDWIESKEISSSHSKTGRDSADQYHRHPSLQRSSANECVMSDLHCSPHNTQSLQPYSNNAGHHGRQNIFSDNHYRTEMERANSPSERFGCKLKRPPYSTSNQYQWSFSPLESALQQQAQDHPDAACDAGYAAPHHHSDTLPFSDAVMCYSHTTYPQMNASITSGATDMHMDTTEVHPTGQHVNAMSPVPPSDCNNDAYSNKCAVSRTDFPSATAPSGSNELHHMTALSPMVNCEQNGPAIPHGSSLLAATDPATALNLTPANRSNHVGHIQQETQSNYKDYGPSSDWH